MKTMSWATHSTQVDIKYLSLFAFFGVWIAWKQTDGESKKGSEEIDKFHSKSLS